MKIEFSECNRMKPHESLIVRNIRKRSEKEYSIVFGEYELLFIPEKDSDKQYLRKIFNNEDFSWTLNLDITIVVKKNNELFLKGKYEVSEFIEEGDYKGSLEIHVISGPSEEFKVYIIPESHENISKIFNKIFE